MTPPPAPPAPSAEAAGSDGLRPIERVVARDEIRQLAYRYAWAIDSRDLDTLVSLFVPDVRAGREARGHEALRANFEEQLSAIGVCILFVGNHLIDFDSPERARGLVYCHARIDDDIEHGGQWIEQAIQYQDRYERRDGQWLFVGRKHLLWYGQTQDRHALDQPAAEWPLHQVGRGTLPEASATWEGFWRKVGRTPPR